MPNSNYNISRNAATYHSSRGSNNINHKFKPKAVPQPILIDQTFDNINSHNASLFNTNRNADDNNPSLINRI